MSTEPSRSDYLIANALAGALNTEEQREFELACTADPQFLREYAAAQSMAERLDDANLTWEDHPVPQGLADKVLAATSGRDSNPEETRRESSGTPLRPVSELHPPEIPKRGPGIALLSAAAAGLLILGGLGGAALGGAFQSPPAGPAGTLGAVEYVPIADAPEGTSIDAALVAHTWGTETVLEVDGFAVGESFEVVLVSGDGEELSSGTFLGSQQTVTCRMNAAVLREDVVELVIRTETGEVVASSTLPGV